MSKPVDGMCGKGIERINAAEYDGDLYEHLKNGHQVILEECVVQHHDLMALHPNSVNTCRVITFTQGSVTNVVAAYLRIGNGRYVDNFNNGGMVVPIEEDCGKLYIRRWIRATIFTMCIRSPALRSRVFRCRCGTRFWTWSKRPDRSCRRWA